jgi:hypothetical protein
MATSLVPLQAEDTDAVIKADEKIVAVGSSRNAPEGGLGMVRILPCEAPDF